MSYFRQTRNVELSTIDYIEACINSSWSGVTTVKSFAQVYADTIKLPVVCIRLSETINNRREIGATTLDNHYSLSIDIFANSDGQRLDLADFVESTLKDGWTYSLYSQNPSNREVLNKVSSGRITVESFVTNARIELMPTTEVKDRFRHNITVLVRPGVRLPIDAISSIESINISDNITCTIETVGPSLIAHWRMNDNFATTDVEDSLWAYTGIANQFTNLLTVPGKINTALSFNGSSDKVNLNTTIPINTANSIAFWSKSNNIATAVPILTNNVSTFGIFTHMQGGATGPIMQHSGNYKYWQNQSAYNDGTWHHWVFILPAIGTLLSTAKLYVDSVEIGTGLVQNGIASSDTWDIIGATSGSWYNGDLDDIRVYDGPIDQIEIDRIWNSGAGTEVD